jgi:SAM-dependent MidA family methyltransferase
MPTTESIPAPLQRIIADAIAEAGGWIGFDTFMSLALYAPGLGYYANGSTKFGQMPQGLVGEKGIEGAGSDFVTAPEISPLFGQALARQVAQVLAATGTDEVFEFGAGTGAMASQVLGTLRLLGQPLRRYTIVDLSDSLKARQRERLAEHAETVRWVSEWPTEMRGVALGNEVLDAMPVQLLARKAGQWHERGVVWQDGFQWSDRPSALRPPVELGGEHDYLTEIHLQGEAFIRTLADRLQLGAAFFLDYGFPEDEYYHPQRHMGTVMCHQAHKADADPLRDVGLKDITAHVNFTGIALAAQDAGLDVLGYTSQAHFLMNCGLVDAMQNQPLSVRVAAQKLIMEHEMGELFKVIACGRGVDGALMGFAQGDRTHRL